MMPHRLAHAGFAVIPPWTPFTWVEISPRLIELNGGALREEFIDVPVRVRIPELADQVEQFLARAASGEKVTGTTTFPGVDGVTRTMDFEYAPIRRGDHPRVWPDFVPDVAPFPVLATVWDPEEEEVAPTAAIRTLQIRAALERISLIEQLAIVEGRSDRSTA